MFPLKCDPCVVRVVSCHFLNGILSLQPNSTHHLQQLADFALRLNEILKNLGDNSENQFTLRVGKELPKLYSQ